MIAFHGIPSINSVGQTEFFKQNKKIGKLKDLHITLREEIDLFLHNIDFIISSWFLWVVLENEKFKKASSSQETENLKIL